MDRSDRRRRQRFRGATLAVLGVVALTTGACSGSDRPEVGQDAGTGSRSTSAPAGDTGTDSPGTGGGDPLGFDRGEPVEIEPKAAFQRLDPTLFADAVPVVMANDAVAGPDGSWLIAGALEDGRERTRDPVLVVVAADGDDGTRRPLPTIGDGPAVAQGIAWDSRGVVAVGWESGEDGGDRALVWTADDPLGDWAVAILPATAGGRYRAERVVTGAGGRYAVGSVGIDGAVGPAVWRARGPAWELLTVVVDRGGERDGPATADTVSVVGAAVTEDGLVAVGLSEAPGRDPRPLVWRELGDRMVAEDGAGLPEGGSLRDVLVVDDGSLLAVGAATEDGRSDPLVARADGPGGPWTTRTFPLDLAGWTSFGGLELARVVSDPGDGDRGRALYASITDPVVQHVYRSTDGGTSWDRIGDLATDTGRDAPVRALAAGADGSLVAVGGQVARIDHDPGLSAPEPGWWEPLAPAELVPDRAEALLANDVAGGRPGFLIGGVAASRSASRHRTDAVLWASGDGRRWERRSLDETVGYAVADVFVGGDGRPGALMAGGSYFTGAHLLTPDEEERWVSRSIPVGEAFLVDSASGPGRAIVAVGYRPDEALAFVEPLFVVIEPDGTTREVPLTDSPIPVGTNAEVVCLAGGPGPMLAVLSWGDGATGVAVSANGERWRGLDRAVDLDRIQVEACGRDADGRFVAAGRDGSGLAAVATSDDGAEWTVTSLGEPGAVLGIDRIGDRLVLSGSVAAGDGRATDGALWGRDGDLWRRLPVDGLESDPFAPAVEITGLAASDGVVVAVGRDRGRAGAWVATEAALDG